jgi:uncharacterized protein
MSVTPQQAEQQIRQWLDQVVIGLQLCPFASIPVREGKVRIITSSEHDIVVLLHLLFDELMLLEETPADELETTLVVLAEALPDFLEFNQFLGQAEQLLTDSGWQGVFQIASFHPQYQFDETLPDAAENLTNRSPYPLLHLLREESLAKAIAAYPDTQTIPERNIRRMQDLSDEQKIRLFPYLFSK